MWWIKINLVRSRVVQTIWHSHESRICHSLTLTQKISILIFKSLQNRISKILKNSSRFKNNLLSILEKNKQLLMKMNTKIISMTLCLKEYKIIKPTSRMETLSILLTILINLSTNNSKRKYSKKIIPLSVKKITLLLLIAQS